MATLNIKPSEILKGVKKAKECKTLKAVQSEIKKVEAIVLELTEQLGDCRLIPNSVNIRLESLDRLEEKMLIEAGKDPLTESVTPVTYLKNKEVAERVEKAQMMSDKEEVLEDMLMQVGEFTPTVIDTITSEIDFDQVMKQAKANGFTLVIQSGNKKVVDWKFADKDGRKYVEVETEAKTKHAYYFDAKAHRIGRYAYFTK